MLGKSTSMKRKTASGGSPLLMSIGERLGQAFCASLDRCFVVPGPLYEDQGKPFSLTCYPCQAVELHRLCAQEGWALTPQAPWGTRHMHRTLRRSPAGTWSYYKRGNWRPLHNSPKLAMAYASRLSWLDMTIKAAARKQAHCTVDGQGDSLYRVVFADLMVALADDDWQRRPVS